MATETIQGHRGTRAVMRMVEFAPSTGGLALWVAHTDAEAELPLLSTDGRTLHYGRAFEALPLAEQTGWVAHGVLHVALRHAQRFAELQRLLGDADLALFNTCADAIVNSALAHLAWLALPAGAVRLEQLLARALHIDQSDEAALLQWDVERLYRAIDDRQQAGPSARPQKRKDGPRAAAARALGEKLAHDLRPAESGNPEQEAEAQREWAERIQRAHAGDGVFSMLRALLADLPVTRTPWEQALRTLLARALAPQPGLSWSRPSRSWLANQGRAGPHRRLPWEPGRTATRHVPKLVVVVGDDAVRRVAHFEPGRSDLREIRFIGGGGTDFTPLLEEAERHDPDIGVFLTDLDGPANRQPRWPVVWAVPEAAAHRSAPFGRLLVLR